MKLRLFTTALALVAVAHIVPAQCPSCDKYLSVLYDRISIKRDISFKAAFESWFFSDAFEKEVRNNSFEGSVTVPFHGLPLTFGGKSESDNAWETWRSNRNSTKWDLSRISQETLFSEIATDNSREIWLQCVKYTCGAQLQILPVTTESLSDKAIYTFSYNANILDRAPKYVNFVCIGGLDCDQANKEYNGKSMKKRGEAIPFSWIDNQNKGGVILNTTSGSTIIELVTRNNAGSLSTGGVTYVTQVLGNPENPEHIEKVGEINEERFFGGASGVKAKNCWTGHLSNDGKWCATLWPQSYTAAPEQILKNFTANCIGGSCGWSNSERFISDPTSKTVGASIRNWSYGTTWKFHADIFKIKTILQLENVPLTITEEVFTAVIPKPYFFPLIEVKLGNKMLLFRPDGQIPKEVEILNTIDSETSTTYIFKVVQ